MARQMRIINMLLSGSFTWQHTPHALHRNLCRDLCRHLANEVFVINQIDGAVHHNPYKNKFIWREILLYHKKLAFASLQSNWQSNPIWSWKFNVTVTTSCLWGFARKTLRKWSPSLSVLFAKNLTGTVNQFSLPFFTELYFKNTMKD